MKVIGLHAENVKRLKAVELKIDTQGGGLVIVSGRNGQGKSSLLDSIAYALGGKRLIPDEPIRKGAKSATVEVTLGGEDVEHGPWTVKRRFTKGGTSIRIENAAGHEFSSPQALLDTFLGDFSFDPLEFLDLKPREQREALLRTVDLGIDLEAIADEHGVLHGLRRDANRDVKHLEGALAEVGEIPEDTPEEEMSVADLAGKLEEAQENNRRIATLRDSQKRDRAEADRLSKQIDELHVRLEKVTRSAAESAGLLETSQSVDEAAIKAALEAVDGINADVRQKRERERIQAELGEARKAGKGADRKMAALLEKRDAALEAAEFPVESLSVDDETVTYGGIALAEAAQSERLKVSVGIAMALNPRLRIVRITDGSLLDTRSMEDLEVLAREHDFDIWIERVSDGQKVGVVIEDGQVVHASEREGVTIE